MPSDLLLRDASTNDVPALERVKAPASLHADRIEHATGGEFRYVVAESDAAEVIGHACLLFHRPHSWGEEDHDPSYYPRIVDLVIHADRRSEGLGGAFLRGLEKICREQGHARMYLSVDPEDNLGALRFYLDRGYRPLCKNPRWLRWSFQDSTGAVHEGESWDLDMAKDLAETEEDAPQDDRFRCATTAGPWPEMTAGRILWFVGLFDELGVTAWIDGGWGVDALLGRQTRTHGDLDIILPVMESSSLVQALKQRGFQDVDTDDRCAENFVMGHPQRGRIDFHLVEPKTDGRALYAARGEEWWMSAAELDAGGFIAGRAVRCLSAAYQIRSHSGYQLRDKDRADLNALHETFGIPPSGQDVR